VYSVEPAGNQPVGLPYGGCRHSFSVSTEGLATYNATIS